MDYTFFGVQILLAAPKGDPLRVELTRIVREMPERVELVEKRGTYQRIRSLLDANKGQFVRGYWDYIADSKRAEKEFETWCSELEQLAGEPRGASGETYREGAAGHALFTMAFLLVRDAAADSVAGQRCDIPEERFFTRATFDALLGTIPMFNFATVKADAIYMHPGDDDDGLTSVELADDGWSYLRPLT